MISITNLDPNSQPAAPDTPVADFEYPDNTPLGKEDNISAAHKKRSKKYTLLGYAQHLLIKHGVTNTKGNRGHKTRYCHSCKAYSAAHATIKLSDNDLESEASFAGLFQCDSVWACPVCAARKAADKATDIGRAIDLSIDNGMMPVLVSLTARHHIGMTLDSFKTDFKAAWSDFTNRRAWRNFKQHFGVEHWIANREPLWGTNGWHYHMHICLLIDKTVIAHADACENMQAVLEASWLHCLGRHGLDGLPDIALQVSAHGDVKSQYLVKLGLQPEAKTTSTASELAGSINKTRGRTVFDLLRHAYHGDVEAENRYIEYVRSMSGDNWITTSHGLWELVEDWDVRSECTQEEVTLKNKPFCHLPDYWVWIIHMAGAYADVLDTVALSRSVPRLRTTLYLIRDDLIDRGVVPIDHKRKKFGIDHIVQWE